MRKLSAPPLPRLVPARLLTVHASLTLNNREQSYVHQRTTTRLFGRITIATTMLFFLHTHAPISIFPSTADTFTCSIIQFSCSPGVQQKGGGSRRVVNSPLLSGGVRRLPPPLVITWFTDENYSFRVAVGLAILSCGPCGAIHDVIWAKGRTSTTLRGWRSAPQLIPTNINTTWRQVATKTLQDNIYHNDLFATPQSSVRKESHLAEWVNTLAVLYKSLTLVLCYLIRLSSCSKFLLL